MMAMRHWGSTRGLHGALSALALLVGMATATEAACNLKSTNATTGGITITGYDGTAAKGSTTTPVTLNVTVAGNCKGVSLSLGLTVVTPIAALTTIGSTTTLAYTVQLSASSATVLPTENGNSVVTSFSVTPTVTITAGQTSIPNNATFTGTFSINVVDSTTGGTTAAAVVPVTVTTLFPKFCTIGGTATPTRGTATIPTSNGRISSVAPITPTLSGGTNVSCSGANPQIQLSSQNSRMTLTPSNSAASFSNAIDYTAAVSLAGGTTATYTSSTGTSVTGTAGSTTGNLVISITPVQVTSPLLSGTYNDVLHIMIVPQ